MARRTGERPEKSPANILYSVDYPISRDDLAQTAAESEAPIDAINFLRALPDRTYSSPEDVQREFAEADACFGLFSRDVHHRGDIGNEAMGPGAAHHPPHRA